MCAVATITPRNDAQWSEIAFQRGSRDRAASAAGLLLTLTMLAIVYVRTDHAALLAALARIPDSPLFLGAFLVSYLVAPCVDWLLLRRLWALPFSGLMPLIRKQAVNEIVLGYSGDAQFYLWARQHVPVRLNPFGTLRDFAILSALAGNVVTIGLMAATYPWLRAMLTGPLLQTFALAIAVMVISSLAILLARGRFFQFTLSRLTASLGMAAYLVRLLVSLALTALLWSLLVPEVGLAMLFGLAALRMMISRLPLAPGKDVILAGASLLLFGRHAGIADSVTLIATLTVAMHVAIFLAGAVGDLAALRRG